MIEHLRPLERFKVDLDKADFQYDAAQAMAVKKLDDLYSRLIARQAQASGLRKRVGDWLSTLTARRRKIMPERGL
ncbi:MAG TPA: cell division protein ZapE, partial [Cellvibrionales bacterium]|nr:cell division protein ZapE [Cellvibrionales bacterium]